jgi:hypothetical protein
MTVAAAFPGCPGEAGAQNEDLHYVIMTEGRKTFFDLTTGYPL